MDCRYRSTFNAHYTDEVYQRMSRLMDERLENPGFQFRLAETPLFLPPYLRDLCVQTAQEIEEIIRRPEIIKQGTEAIPDRYNVPGRSALPHLNAIDLGICRTEDGRLEPRLIELQAFSSLYGMQLFQAEVWGDVVAEMPGMPRRWTPLLSGLDRDSYLRLLKRTMIGDCDVDEVILLDIDPQSQKTKPDFHATAQLLGIRAICISELTREGRRLFAPKDGKPVPVKRILNRVVFDELAKSDVEFCFDYNEDLDVTWIAHPDWYWVWSKYTLPLIQHPALPRTTRLSDVSHLPDDLQNYILKPLFSFAGQGVQVDLDRETLDAIPDDDRENWLLQEKVEYAPALMTPDGSGVKAEIRMMFLRPDDTEEMTLAINLVRFSRGKMHGVDHNKGLSWVGSSVGIWPADEE